MEAFAGDGEGISGEMAYGSAADHGPVGPRK